MSSSAESNYETSSTILNQDQHEQFGRDDEATILKDNDENENLDISLQHENETVNTATTNEDNGNSLVQDSLLIEDKEQDILQDEEYKIEIGPIDEDCLPLNVSFTSFVSISI